MTNELGVWIPHHQTGPEQDRAARLAVVRAMHGRAFSYEEIYETLDMLALLPGQEAARNIAGANINSLPQEQTCGPKRKPTNQT